MYFVSFLIKHASLMYYSIRPSVTYGIGCCVTSKKPTGEEMISDDNFADIEDDDYDDVDDQDDSIGDNYDIVDVCGLFIG